MLWRMIVAGKSALGRIKDLLFGVVLKGNYPPVEITLDPLEPGLIFDEDDFTVSAFPVYHRTPDCFGFVFEERARRPFLPEKAEKLGGSLSFKVYIVLDDDVWFERVLLSRRYLDKMDKLLKHFEPGIITYNKSWKFKSDSRYFGFDISTSG